MIRTLKVIVLLMLLADSAWAAREFVHPGTLDTRENLAFVKMKVATGEDPWSYELALLQSSAASSRLPAFRAYVTDHVDSGEARDDAIGAYAQALLWVLTDDSDYAKSAIRILDAWSGFEGFDLGTDQDKLRAGWIGAVLSQAAELMRNYEGWSESARATLQAMFRRAYYPHLKIPSPWNGNVDLTQIDAMISIAVFNEDEALFDLALERFERRIPAYVYLSSDGDQPVEIEGDGGNIPHFWFEPDDWTDGLTQETCRDNGHHSQYGLGSALHVAEVAWNQGVDIYTRHQQRLSAAMELLAQQLLTDDFAVCRETTASKSRFNTWEAGYNHYHHRAGLDMPHTRRLIQEQIRTESERATWNLVYETLTHAEVSVGMGSK